MPARERTLLGHQVVFPFEVLTTSGQVIANQGNNEKQNIPSLMTLVT